MTGPNRFRVVNSKPGAGVRTWKARFTMAAVEGRGYPVGPSRHRSLENGKMTH